MSQMTHWSEDSYWTDALLHVGRLLQQGPHQLVIDLDVISSVAFQGDGPAYKLMEAMISVYEMEGEEGFKGAPRVMLALLVRLAELSHLAENSNSGKDV